MDLGSLPDVLTGATGQMLCFTIAPHVQGYLYLLDTSPLAVVHRQDASETVLKLLANIGAKLDTFRVLLSLGSAGDAGPSEAGNSTDRHCLLSQALALLDEVKTLVEAGRVGYWLLVSEKGS